jgi:hypothetical protein
MFKRFLLLALVLGLVSTAYGECTACDCLPVCEGAKILVVGDSGYEPGGKLDADDYTKAMGGRYPDESLVAWLECLGYDVDTCGLGGDYRHKDKNNDYPDHNWWEGQDDRLQRALDADLIIFSRYASSGCYARNGEDQQHWNGLPVPLICQSGHQVRHNKWAWTDGDKDSVINADGSWPTDICLCTAFSMTVFDWTPGEGQYVQNPNGNWICTAKVAATYGDDVDGKFPFIVHISEGSDFDEFRGVPPELRPLYGIAGDRRAYFGHATTDQWSWDTGINCLYKALFAGVIYDMIPEPATIALLGLGGLSLLRRRR